MNIYIMEHVEKKEKPIVDTKMNDILSNYIELQKKIYITKCNENELQKKIYINKCYENYMKLKGFIGITRAFKSGHEIKFNKIDIEESCGITGKENIETLLI